MADKPQPSSASSASQLPTSSGQFGSESGDPATSRRPVVHRGDMRDTVAELAGRAQVISQEAGSKVSAAMKDVIGAAAGIAGFAIESARDLVQYMVRRGQMTPEEGDRLIREAEAAHDKRSPGERGRPAASKVATDRAAAHPKPLAKPAAVQPKPIASAASKPVGPKDAAAPKSKPSPKAATPPKAAKPAPKKKK
jgi:hypothetical protein